MSMGFSKSSVLKSSFAAAICGVLVLGGMHLRPRFAPNANHAQGGVLRPTKAIAPSTMETQMEPQVDSQKARIQGMSDAQRAQYMQQLLDDMGDGGNAIEDSSRLGDLGSQAALAVEPLIRCATASHDPWPQYIALARIGEPSGRISTFLAQQISQGENPVACAALALLGAKAKQATGVIDEVYARAAVNFEARRSRIHSDVSGIGDGDSNDNDTLISFDSAIALLATDQNSSLAISAVSRIMDGDPRVNWQSGSTEYGEILLSGVRATDKPDYWYGMAIVKAFDAVRNAPELRHQLVSSLIEGTGNGNILVAASSAEAESVRAERSRKEDALRKKAEDKRRSQVTDAYPAPFDPPAYDILNPRGNNNLRMGNELSASTAGRMIEIRRVRERAMRQFCCWALRNLTGEQWTQQERDLDLSLQRVEVLGQEQENEQQKKAMDIMVDPWRYIHPGDSSRAPEYTAECLGLLRATDRESLNFLQQLISQSDASAVAKGRAALALGRIGSEAKGSSALLQACKENDPSPSVRKSAAWALGEIAK